MSNPEVAKPVKRAPGRPRKIAVKAAEEVADVWKTPDPMEFPADERVGQRVADDRWTSISFDDGRSYRVEDGVIVERVA